jgi:light-harvesting protein B-800-850 alpha chain
MNNAKIWLVVKPTVGVPLFLSAVALGSVMVHTQVLNRSTWLPAFLEGKAKPRRAEAPGTTIAGSANAVVVFNASDAQAGDAARDGTVVLPDGRTARVVFDAPAQPSTTASLATTATR